jgi:uncharacterized protein with FMN-binding domain
MRRILVAVTGTIAGVIAVFLYPTSVNQTVAVSTVTGSTSTSTSSTGTTSSSSPTSSASSSPTSSASSSPTSSASSSSSSTASGTFSSTTSMRYGTVTVTITVKNGQVTAASGSQSSNDNRSQMIASQAIPTLNSAAVAAQSAKISLASHATYTSDAYVQSLQAAIDQAFGS